MTQTQTQTPVTNVLCRQDRYIGDGDSYYGVITFKPGVTEAHDTFGYETIGSTYDYGKSIPTVEASPEIKERAARAYGRIARELKLDEIAERARELERGKHVTVSAPRARNRPKTGEGKIFWIGKSQSFYRYNASETKVGVELNDGTKGFYSPGEVEVLDAEDYIDYATVNDIARYVEHAVTRPSFQTAYAQRARLIPRPVVTCDKDCVNGFHSARCWGKGGTV